MKLREFFIVLVTIVAVSCRPSARQVTDTHEGEEVKITLTSYNSMFEFFAEADPFVVGETSNVLSHFTWLYDFKPLDSAKITVHLNVGDNKVSQTIGQPTRKGIYSFDLNPSVPGNGSLVFEISSKEGNYELVVPSVEVYSDGEEAVAEAEKLEPSQTNTIVFTKEQSWKIDFSTDLPTVGPFGQVIRTTAQVQSAQSDETIISAKAGGVVVFTGKSIPEGQRISAGATLFTISGAGLAENNASLLFTEAHNQYLKTKADYERQKELAQDKIVSEKELLATKNDFENARARYEMLTDNFNVSGQLVSSPSSGYIKQLYVRNGQYVEAGQPVISVSKNSSLLLKADIQQKYASVTDKIISANIIIPGDNRTYTLEQLNGKVLAYGRNTNSDNYMIPVTLQIDNNGGLIPGVFVEVYLKTVTNNMALVVPNSSLLEEQGNFFVFVQVTPELFEKRDVKVGPTDGVNSEIIGGLNRNERIVSKGAIMVKLAQASGALDPHAGHVH